MGTRCAPDKRHVLEVADGLRKTENYFDAAMELQHDG
jgi:hypothetical protein